MHLPSLLLNILCLSVAQVRHLVSEESVHVPLMQV